MEEVMDLQTVYIIGHDLEKVNDRLDGLDIKVLEIPV